jgi:hypothetical protein
MHERGWFDMLDASQFVAPARPARASPSGQFNLF